MTETTLERPDVVAYLDAVRARLADLPAEERDDLVEDVRASLLESGEPPALSPQEFAAELREAAGLVAEPSARPQPSQLDSFRTWLGSERVTSLRATARELAPIWWLARAYVVVALLNAFSGLSFEGSVLALAGTGAVSVWLGLRGRSGSHPYRRVGLAANYALALAALMLLPLGIYSSSQFRQVVDSGSPGPVVFQVQPGLSLDGTPIQNIYPYTRDGKPLFDVLFYNEFGQPISVLSADDSLRRVLRDENGAELFNSYPIRYFEPGTTTVARPELAPTITVPKVVTPPLKLSP